VVRRCPREWQAECDVHRVAERRNFDGCHADIVVRGDHCIELAPHRAHENGIGRERTGDPRSSRRRCKKLRVFVTESPRVARVRIECAECDFRLGDVEPASQGITCDGCHLNYRRSAQFLTNLAQGNVRRRQYHAQSVGGEHHRDAGAGEVGEHFSMSRIIVAARV